MRLHLTDEAAMQALAKSLALQVLPGDVILLEGPLGAGKTNFARAFIRVLAEDPALEIPSPTFTLVQVYDTPAGTVTHYDLWRLENHRALEELAWDEAQDGIVLVEWPDRLGPLVPAHALHITITITPEGRDVTMHGPTKWSVPL